MKVNQTDGSIRDEFVITGPSGEKVGVNGDRLKVDANLSVDNVTVSNVGITSVDGAAMESTGKYMPVKLTGSNVKETVLINNITVTPGSTIYQSSVNMTDCDFFRVIYENTVNTNYRIGVFQQNMSIGYAAILLAYDGTQIQGKDDQFPYSYPNASRNIWSKLYTPFCATAKFSFENQGGSEVTVSVKLVKLSRRGVV